MFTSDNLRTLFQHRFSQASWLDCLQRLFCADELRANPDPVYFQRDEGFYCLPIPVGENLMQPWSFLTVVTIGDSLSYVTSREKQPQPSDIPMYLAALNCFTKHLSHVFFICKRKEYPLSTSKPPSQWKHFQMSSSIGIESNMLTS